LDPIHAIALALGASWASGLNLYAAVLALGAMHDLGYIALPPDLQLLGDPLVLIAAGAMYAIEFVADKIPGVDSGWDALHTFIRIPAGAILAAQALGPVDPALALAAGLLGGTLAGMSHAVKASGRVLINTSPEPFSNWAASVTEDALVFGGLWAAVSHPIAFLIALAGFAALAIWLLPRLWRLLRRAAARVAGFFRGERAAPPAEPEPALTGGQRPARPAPAAAPRLRRSPRPEGDRGYRGGTPPRS
jgi:hypothetical protein